MSESEQILLNLLEDPSFVRWINGRAVLREQKKWEQWEMESPDHAAMKRQARILYNLPVEKNEGDDMEEQAAQLQNRIKERKNLLSMPTEEPRREAGYRWAMAAAVALIVGLVGVFTVYNYGGHDTEQVESEPLYSTIEVGYGEKGVLKISDGSTIRLNANSSLRYRPGQFNKSRVEVWLKGEAFFAISRNPGNRERRFIVHTPDGNIRVLGTRFNVNTRFNQTGVVLEEGSVEIVMSDTLEKNIGKIILKPGQRAQFSAQKTDIKVQEVDTSLYTAWLDGKLVFEDMLLGELTRNIEQTYGVDIKFTDSSMVDQKISGSFRNPDLQTLLEGLEVVLNVDIVQKADNTFLISEQQQPRD